MSKLFENPKSVASIIVTLVGLINWLLIALGQSPLAIAPEAVNIAVTGAFSLVGMLGTAWYNLSLTTPAQLGDKLAQGLKDGTVSLDEATAMLSKLIDTASDTTKE